MEWLGKIKNGLFKTSSLIKDGIASIFSKRSLDPADLEQLEQTLLKTDMGAEVVEQLIAKIQKQGFGASEKPHEDLQNFLKQELQTILGKVQKKLPLFEATAEKPRTFLIYGINGSGKTTTTAKLAQRLTHAGYKTMVAAADTFRAAAIEQLEMWVRRIAANGGECEIFAADYGSDPASVAYRAYQEAHRQGKDALLIDTAGRLHNNPNLMDELAKCFRALAKINLDLPHCSILVIDGTNGQNAIKQIEMFKKYVKIDGIIVTKLDGTAKGGIIINIAQKFALPIFAVGVGEKAEDLLDFDSETFVKTLLNIEN